jgi:hypothetical protein
MWVGWVEVLGCSGGLGMLNPDMKSYGAFEAARQRPSRLLAEQQRRFLVASAALWQGHEWLIRVNCGDLAKAR